MIELLHNIVVGALLLIGAGFTFVATVGLLRLPDLYSRMHSASKVGTVGSGCILIALALFSLETAIVTRALAAIVFLILTAPISAHLLAKASYVAGYRMWSGSVHDDMAETLGEGDSNEPK